VHDFRRTAVWRVADGSVLNIADIANDPHTATNETFRSRDVHSFVLVTMVRDEEAIGAIPLNQSRRRRLLEERVRLLKTFAAQAVLAIENVRLLSVLRARTAQLTRSVEELTALGEVSRAPASPEWQWLVRDMHASSRILAADMVMPNNRSKFNVALGVEAQGFCLVNPHS
jgi:GAF domain-containing protein